MICRWLCDNRLGQSHLLLDLASGRNGSGVSTIQFALEALQVGLELSGVCVTQVTILLKCLLDDVVELRRHIRIQPGQCDGLLIQNGVEDNCCRLTAKRGSACRHLVEDRAEGEQIAAASSSLPRASSGDM